MSRVRPALASAALAVALAACTTTANYQKLMDSLVGADVNEVLRAWGPPTQTVTTVTGSETVETLRRTDIEVDASGRIKS